MPISEMASNEPTSRNSAGRLLALLTSFSDSGLMEEVPRLFKQKITTPENARQAVLVALIEVHKVYLEFRDDMLAADISEKQRNVLLAGLVSIEQSIYPHQVGQAIRKLTDAEKSLLEVCATIIPEEGVVTKDEIDRIRESIAELRASVEKGQISQFLRKTLLELIRLSEEAISRFKIHGARGLRRAFKAMLAEAAELYGLADPERDREELKSSGLWSKIVKLLSVVDSIASKALKYKPLLDSLLTSGRSILLPSPSDSGVQPPNMEA